MAITASLNSGGQRKTATAWGFQSVAVSCMVGWRQLNKGAKTLSIHNSIKFLGILFPHLFPRIAVVF
ncbi:hypothetical protein LJR129_002813 [Acidovorax sp. LjRoot129]|uniref:hypothetical protein n=1 Tax=Acidovorax sp. LjRoot129 TaxID=3342260 RepID=UPI003ECE30AB